MIYIKNKILENTLSLMSICYIKNRLNCQKFYCSKIKYWKKRSYEIFVK